MKGPDFAPPEPGSRPAGAARRAVPVRRRWWEGALALLVAFVVVGALVQLLPDEDDPRRPSRGEMGQWATVGDQRVRVIDVVASDRATGWASDEAVVPGATFLMVTLESEALATQQYVAGSVSLISAGRTYSPNSDLAMFPDAEPGFISHGQLVFVVPDARAGRGTIEIGPDPGFYTGVQRPVVRIGFRAPEQVPVVEATEGKVRVA